MCVQISYRNIKKLVQLSYTLGEYMQQNQEFEGIALKPFFHVVLRLNGVLNVQLNYHIIIKASVKLMTFDRENQIIPWQGVYFFTNTVLQKTQKHNVLMENMVNTIGKKMHTLVKENTPRCHKIRQKCGFTQKVAFLLHSIVFSSPLLCEYWQGGQTHAS